MLNCLVYPLGGDAIMYICTRKKKKRYFTRGSARGANLAYCTAIISCYILIIIVNLIRNTTTMCFYNLNTIRRPEGEE